MNLSGAHILLVEDEAIIAFALEDMLERAGARTVLATTVEAACEAIEAEAFDCGILDVNLHGEKSYPAAARLQAGNVPFVFATGYGDTAHPPEFAGVRTISKPYSPAQVREAIAALD